MYSNKIFEEASFPGQAATIASTIVYAVQFGFACGGVSFTCATVLVFNGKSIVLFGASNTPENKHVQYWYVKNRSWIRAGID